MPREPEAGRRGVRRAAEQERVHAPRRGARGAASRVRHDDLAERHPERGAVRAVDVHRLVERPEPQAQAIHAVADIRRAGAQRRPGRVRLLLLRAAHGSGGIRGIHPVVHYRQYSGAVPGRVRLRW